MQKSSSVFSNGVALCAVACLCCALWGSAYPCVKIGYTLFQVDTGHTPSVILFAGARFFLAGILAVLIGSAANKAPLFPRTRRTWRHVFHLSLLQTVLQYFFFYIGLAHTTGVKASIIGASGTFIALAVAVLLFHQEHFTPRKVLGCIIGFAGVVLVNLGQGELGGVFRAEGEGFLLLSAVSYAFSSVFMKRYSAEDAPILLSGWQFILGGAVLALGGIVLGGRLHPAAPAAFFMLLYLACISAVAYSLWGILLKYNPVSRVAVFSFMTPVFGVLLSSLLLQESARVPALPCLIALAMVCLGIYFVNSTAHAKSANGIH